MYMYVFAALIPLVAAVTIRERHLFRSALAQVRLQFESGVYSRAASIRSLRYIRMIEGCVVEWCEGKMV